MPHYPPDGGGGGGGGEVVPVGYVNSPPISHQASGIVSGHNTDRCINDAIFI